MAETVYKALGENGRSPYRAFNWGPYLPDGASPGKPLPELSGSPVICGRGYHGYKTVEQALRPHRRGGTRYAPNVYEMELSGEVVDGGGPGTQNADKKCATGARLIRQVRDRDGEVEIVPLSAYIWQ